MQTAEQFAASERSSIHVRALIVAVAIVAATFLTEGRWGLAGTGVVAAAYLTLFAIAWFTARPHPSPLRRQAALLTAEAALVAAALCAFGTSGPALAFPVVLAAHYAFLLGPRGAAAGGIGALGAIVTAVLYGGASVTQTFGTAIPLIATAAALPAFAAHQRAVACARMELARTSAPDESDARRVLSALLPVASADGETQTARAIASALPAVTGYPAAVVFLRPLGSEELVLTAAAMGENQAILTGAPPEPVDGDTAAALAVTQGVALSLGGRDGALPLPPWARERGLASGIVAPITAGAQTIGVAYVLRPNPKLPLLGDMERAETLLGLSARFLVATRRHSSGRPETDRLTRVLEEAGRSRTSGTSTRKPISIPGLELDPDTERISISDVAVSLSRTEFALLHSLAESPGTVVDPVTLRNSTWDGTSQPGSNAVDVAMHRLRRKLAKAPGGNKLVKTVRGKGYVLLSPETR